MPSSTKASLQICNVECAVPSMLLFSKTGLPSCKSITTTLQKFYGNEQL